MFNIDMIRIVETKRYFNSIFKMKDFGEMDTILGIKVKKHNNDYALNQLYYIKKMLNKFKHFNIKGS